MTARVLHCLTAGKLIRAYNIAVESGDRDLAVSALCAYDEHMGACWGCLARADA